MTSIFSPRNSTFGFDYHTEEVDSPLRTIPLHEHQKNHTNSEWYDWNLRKKSVAEKEKQRLVRQRTHIGWEINIEINAILLENESCLASFVHPRKTIKLKMPLPFFVQWDR